MMSHIEMFNIVKACTYKPGWYIAFIFGSRPYIQIETTTTDGITNVRRKWKSDKTYLYDYMCKQEIVSAVYGAIEKAELHNLLSLQRRRHFQPSVTPMIF